LAGVEYAGECCKFFTNTKSMISRIKTNYVDCGNSFSNGGGPAPDGTTGCDMACNGNTTETCGGPNRLDVYDYNDAIATITISNTASSTLSSATGTATGTATTTGGSTTSTSPVATSLPAGWTYKGCWVDQAYGRILSTSEADNSALTIESCIATCIAAGYSIAGMEYYTQCFCGDAIINQGVLATSQSDCNTACGGDSAEICGGGDRMSIYSNQTTLDVVPVPVAQTTDLPGSWNYTGCLS